MSLEPKHMNFKDEYKIKEQVKHFFKYQAPHVYISGFRMTILPGTSKLVIQSL